MSKKKKPTFADFVQTTTEFYLKNPPPPADDTFVWENPKICLDWNVDWKKAISHYAGPSPEKIAAALHASPAFQSLVEHKGKQLAYYRAQDAADYLRDRIARLEARGEPDGDRDEGDGGRPPSV